MCIRDTLSFDLGSLKVFKYLPNKCNTQKEGLRVLEWVKFEFKVLNINGTYGVTFY